MCAHAGMKSIYLINFFLCKKSLAKQVSMHALHVLYTRTTNFLLYLIPIDTVSVGKQVHVFKEEIFMMPTKSVNVHMPNKIRVA